VIDDELDALMTGVAAIEINGPRAVGKTSTTRVRAASVFALDEPQVRAIVASNPDRIAAGPYPVLIDEWQRMPQTWDIVRRAVDADRLPGRFLLTGSASPRNPPTHTGAGRIVSLAMRPMTLAERGVGVPTVSLAELLTGRREGLGGSTDVIADEYAHEILASGFPGLRDLPDRAIRAELDGYISRVIDRDLEDAGGPVRNTAALRRWLTAYAAATSSSTSYEKIRDAASANRGEKPAKTTVLRYLDILESIWLIEPVPGWKPTTNRLSRLTLAPKHQLADPALAARLRRATMDALVKGDPAGPLAPRHTTLFGALFEALVTLNVRVYAQAAEATVTHFRDFGGAHEVDLVVEGANQRVLAIEVKLAVDVDDEDVRHLVWLRDRIGEDLLDAIVVTTGREAYRRSDGIGVVPAALLGP
jgi:hypothetical protein